MATMEISLITVVNVVRRVTLCSLPAVHWCDMATQYSAVLILCLLGNFFLNYLFIQYDYI